MPSPGTQPLVRPRASEQQDTAHAPPWHVVVWDDPINLMNYVSRVFMKVFGYNRALADKLMLEVHTQGRSRVATEPREQAELHVTQLHAHGLQATLEKAES